MKQFQALWPSQPIRHGISALALTADGQSIWTGDIDGQILKWTVGAGGAIAPVLALSYHRHRIHAITVDEKEERIISWDLLGNLACWKASSGECVMTQRHNLLSGKAANGGLMHFNGESEMVCPVSMDRENSSDGDINLVGIDTGSFEIRRISKTSVRKRLIKSGQSLQFQSTVGCKVLVENGDQSNHLLELVRFGDSHGKRVFLGITSDGVLLLWMSDGSQEAAEKAATQILQSPLTQCTSVPLTSASFNARQRLLVLTDAASWSILRYDVIQGHFPSNFRLLASDTPIRLPLQPMDEGGAVLDSLPSFLTTERKWDTQLLQEKDTDVSFYGPIIQGVIIQSGREDVQTGDSVFLVLYTRGGTVQLFQIQSSGQWTLRHVRQTEISCNHVMPMRDGNVIVEIYGLETDSESRLTVSQLERDSEDGTPILEPIASGCVSDLWHSVELQPKGEWKPGRGEGVVSVTCMYLITSVVSEPYILAQGMSNGEIVYDSLAFYACLHGPGANGMVSTLAVSKGHDAAVLLCTEIVFHRPLSPSGEEHEEMHYVPMLVTGTANGAVGFWSLAPDSLGQSLFIVRPHSDRVEQFMYPAAPMTSPWQSCLASVGSDGVVALISVEERRTVRLCSGNPTQTPLRLHWDAKRGFLSCLASHAFEVSLLSVWDLNQSRRDRIFHGAQAAQMEELFVAGLEEYQEQYKTQHGEERNPHSPYITAFRAKKNDLCLFTGLSSNITLLTLAPIEWLTSAVDGSEEQQSDEERVRIATALSALHLWGMDPKTDAYMQSMLRQVVENRTSDAPDNRTPPTEGFSLTQGVCIGHAGGMAIDFPKRMDGVSLGQLWLTNGEFLTDHLVFMMALSKQLMHGIMNETVCSACNALATMYAIHLPQSIKHHINPSLFTLVDLWDESIPVIKETAHILLASLTNLPAIIQRVNETGSPALAGLREMRAAFALVHNAWSLETANDLAYHNDILVSGAICCAHSRFVTTELLSVVLPLMTTLSTDVTRVTRSSVLSTLIMAEAFMGIEGMTWLTSFPHLPSYIKRVLDACDNVEASLHEAEYITVGISTSVPSPLRTMSKVQSMAEMRQEALRFRSEREALSHRIAESPGALSRNRPHHRHSAIDIRKQFDETSSTAVHLSRPPKGRSPQNLEILTEETASDHLQKMRSALVALVTSLVHLDLPSVMESVQQRLPSENAYPFSLVAVAQAVRAKLGRGDGIQSVVRHLPVVVSTLLRALDPSDQPSKHMTASEVTSLINEIQHHYPMINVHQESASLAVGCPHIAMRYGQEQGERSQEEVIAIFNTHTGQKKRSLSLGRVFYELASQWSPEVAQAQMGIGALCFRRDGELLVAVCPEVRALCVWNLRLSWQQKLSAKQRDPTEPIKIHQIRSAPDLSSGDESGLIDLSFKVKWQLQSQVAVLQGSEQLDSLELHVGH